MWYGGGDLTWGLEHGVGVRVYDIWLGYRKGYTWGQEHGVGHQGTVASDEDTRACHGSQVGLERRPCVPHVSEVQLYVWFRTQTCPLQLQLLYTPYPPSPRRHLPPHDILEGRDGGRYIKMILP